MFNIDRSYIDTSTAEETLQSRIIFIRSKYKGDSSMPLPKDLGIDEEEYDEYIDKKQDYSERQKAMKRKGPIALAILFCIPPVVVNLYDKSNLAFFLSFLASIILVGIIFILYKVLDSFMVKRHTNARLDEYTDKLLEWFEEKRLKESE